MAVGVLVVVSIGEIAAQLLLGPAETLVAGVVFTWGTIAITAPVAEGFGDQIEFSVVSEHGTALAHCDVVCGVKTQGGDVTEGAHQLTVVDRTQRVTAVFYQPQVVLLAECGDHIQIERVAQAVGQHDGFGLGRNGGLNFRRINVMCGQIQIYEHWYRAKLNDWIDSCWKSCSNADHLVPLLNGAIT